MANREQKGNREKRKPKKEKPKAATPISSSLAGVAPYKTTPGKKGR
jgi:hypothetical protein